ncbi:HEAT repeat domain-containing protein [Phototrophicus methaneseepsis]|uniref:HEAT repeat domain-containing protein n=1 Tax=Phototrophicus methaneseepsis TaxID=2710758 RepID=A0A7S8IG33_9CHLR|nr:HEAT repeat domain-containing protein [Phototrophicus methaneseepsis]QPC84271.1 HEAT repeat domain-containing protein [Phototrophicus methaneseepsis]
MSQKEIDIWRLQAQKDIDGLIQALRSPSAQRRKRAAAALLALDAKSAIPALQEVIKTEPDTSTKTGLVTALNSLIDDFPELPTQLNTAMDKRQILVDRLIDKLTNDNPDVVVAAAQSLVNLREASAFEPLMQILRDEGRSIQVRAGIAEALLKMDDTSVKETLLKMLRHSNVQTRHKTAAILGQLKAEWSIIPLTKHLRDPNNEMRKVVRAALRHIGTPEARRALAHNQPLETDMLNSKVTTTGLLNRLQKRRPQAKNAPRSAQDGEQEQPRGLLERLNGGERSQQDIDATMITRPPVSLPDAAQPSNGAADEDALSGAAPQQAPQKQMSQKQVSQKQTKQAPQRPSSQRQPSQKQPSQKESQE